MAAAVRSVAAKIRANQRSSLMRATSSLIEHMPTAFLSSIAEKVSNKTRLTSEEGLRLLLTEEPEQLEAIRALADYVRYEKVGDTVHFASCLFVYPTNLCEL